MINFFNLKNNLVVLIFFVYNYGVLLLFPQVQKTSEIRLKHLTTACDEVTKFEEELSKFDEWLTQSCKELDRQEELIRDLDNFSRVMEQQKVEYSQGEPLLKKIRSNSYRSDWIVGRNLRVKSTRRQVDYV